MPKVGSKSFSYSPVGKKSASSYAKKMGMKEEMKEMKNKKHK
jgi:hypothetical protein